MINTHNARYGLRPFKERLFVQWREVSDWRCVDFDHDLLKPRSKGLTDELSRMDAGHLASTEG